MYKKARLLTSLFSNFEAQTFQILKIWRFKFWCSTFLNFENMTLLQENQIGERHDFINYFRAKKSPSDVGVSGFFFFCWKHLKFWTNFENVDTQKFAFNYEIVQNLRRSIFTLTSLFLLKQPLLDYSNNKFLYKQNSYDQIF